MRSVAFARRRVTWWSNTTCDSSKGSSPSTSKGKVAAMRLGSVKGRVKACVASEGPGSATTTWSGDQGFSARNTASVSSSGASSARRVSA